MTRPLRQFMRVPLLALALAVPTVAAAHHGWSSYDAARPLRLSGAIVTSSYEHPHGTLQLKAADKTWASASSSPASCSSQRDRLSLCRVSFGSELGCTGVDAEAGARHAALSLGIWTTTIGCGRLLAYV